MMNVLDELLRGMANRPVPPLSGQFEQRVWRAIRQRQAEPEPGWLEAWLSLFWQPRFAAATLAVGLGIGLAMGAWEDRRDYVQVRQSLHLEEFSSRAPSLASTLVAHRH